MSRPSKAKIDATLKDLRKLIDTSKDPCEQRIAYGMETAIRWATEDTRGWGGMAVFAKDLAKLLRQEIYP